MRRHAPVLLSRVREVADSRVRQPGYEWRDVERRWTECERRSVAMRMTRKRAVEPEAGEVEQYAGAFARVRLVRAWIAAAAAMVAMLYGYVALLERVVK